MAGIYISIGSNIERHKHIQIAIDELHALFGALVISTVYESDAVGFDGQPFFNLVVGATTALSAKQVNAALKSIEFRHGRTIDAKKFSSRTLDLDLLLYDDLVTQDGVQLPRDEIAFNAFLLWPLAEIAPELIHPTLGKCYATLWDEYQLHQVIRPITFHWSNLICCEE